MLALLLVASRAVPIAAYVSGTRHTWEKRGGDYIAATAVCYAATRYEKWVHNSVGAQ